MAPLFNWPAYFAASGKPQPGAINVDCPAALAAAAAAAAGGDAEAKEDLKEDLRAYLRWHATNSCAEYLSEVKSGRF